MRRRRPRRARSILPWRRRNGRLSGSRTSCGESPSPRRPGGPREPKPRPSWETAAARAGGRRKTREERASMKLTDFIAKKAIIAEMKATDKKGVIVEIVAALKKAYPSERIPAADLV